MTTTLTDLKEAPAATRNCLVEITVGEQLSETWTQHGTYTDTYYITYLYEIISLQDGKTSKINKEVTAMKYDGTSLTAQASIADVNTNNNSYWHDTVNQLLYVHLDNGSTVDPTVAAVLVAYFKMFFANKGIYFNDNYYEPYIIGAPGIRQSTDHLLTGKSDIGGGNLVFVNTSGFFDVIIEKFIWSNRSVKLLYGGDTLPYSEYGDGFAGIIIDKSWSLDTVMFTIKNVHRQLLRQIPEELYTIADYPNLAEWAVGLPKPIAYGIHDNINAVKVIPIDESYGTDQVQYSIAGHLIFAINGAEVSYDGGATWITLALNATPNAANEYGIIDLTNATFVVQFTAGNYVTGEVQVKVAFEGRENSDTTAMISTADMIEDLLINYNGFLATDLNTSEFSDSKAESNALVAIYIHKVQRTADIIDKIAGSEVARFYVDNSGLFVYHVWAPESPTGLTDLDNKDLLDYKVRYNSKEHFTKIKVGYKQSHIDMDHNYRFVSDSNTNKANLYGEAKQKLVYTYLTTKSQAITLAARLLLLHETPLMTVTGKIKMQLITHNVGDKITMTLSDRVPSNVSGGWSAKIFELVSLVKDFIRNEISFKADDLKNIGTSIGMWMGSSAPNWATATEDERQQSGFWCDSSSYADPAQSQDSFMVSRWW